MAILKIKRRKNATKTIDTGIETYAKAKIAVNREIAISAAMKIITSNEIMETLTVVKVEATVVTQETDPATTTAMGEEIKTDIEPAMHTDKMDADETIKTKATATLNADTIPATISDAEKTRHTRSTLTTKAMMDKTLTFRTTAMTMPPIMKFTLPTKSFTRQTRPMPRKKMMNLPKIQMTQA
jgi:hypothetical protein